MPGFERRRFRELRLETVPDRDALLMGIREARQ